MSVTIRPHRRGGWEADNRVVTPDGARQIRERKRAPVSSRSAAERWAEGRERILFLRLMDPLQHTTERKEGPTLGEFASRFLDGHARANRQKPSSIAAKDMISCVALRVGGHDVTSAPALEPRAAVARGPRPARGVRPPPRPDRRGSARPAVLPPRRRAAPPDAEPGVHARHRSHTGARHRRQRRCLFTVLQRVVLNPLPYGDASRLLSLEYGVRRHQRPDRQSVRSRQLCYR